MSPCTWGVLYQSAEKPMVWTLPERPAARSAMPGGKRIGSKAPLCSRKGEARPYPIGMRDGKARWMRIFKPFFAAGRRKTGCARCKQQRREAASVARRLCRRKGHGFHFPDASFYVPSPICSSSRSAPFPEPCASFLVQRRKWRLWQRQVAVGDFARGRRDACPRNDDRSRRNA